MFWLFLRAFASFDVIMRNNGRNINRSSSSLPAVQIVTMAIPAAGREERDGDNRNSDSSTGGSSNSYSISRSSGKSNCMSSSSSSSSRSHSCSSTSTNSNSSGCNRRKTTRNLTV